MKIWILNAWNAVKRFLKKFAINIYLILLIDLCIFLYVCPECKEVIALLTFFSGVSILAVYFKITTYIELKASSKSSCKCELK